MLSKSSWLTIVTLWQREITRFYRQPSRIVGAIGSPFIFWLLIGSGLGSSFRTTQGAAAGSNYSVYFFSGTILLILLFTAIFSTISLIEDRREGFFQAVLIAPVPRISIVLGKVLGGATLAFIQGMIFLMLAPTIGISLNLSCLLNTGLAIALNAIAMTGLGFFIAWQFNSIQGFHAIMNLFLMPMWILSGALFPQGGAAPWVQSVMKCNPLSYGLSYLQRAIHGNEIWGNPEGLQVFFVTVGFAASMLVASAWLASVRSTKDVA